MDRQTEVINTGTETYLWCYEDPSDEVLTEVSSHALNHKSFSILITPLSKMSNFEHFVNEKDTSIFNYAGNDEDLFNFLEDFQISLVKIKSKG